MDFLQDKPKDVPDSCELLESAGAALILLDGLLYMMSFTPAAKAVFALTHDDIGHLLAETPRRLDYPESDADIWEAMGRQGMVEREAGNSATGLRYLCRLVPHGLGAIESRSTEVAAPSSLAVTFMDITAAHRAQQAVQDSEERFRMMAAAVPTLSFIAVPDLHGQHVSLRF